MLREKISSLLDEFHGAGFEQPDYDLAEVIIRIVADDIERINVIEPPSQRDYIVEYLRGLLDN